MPLKLRGGPESERAAITPAERELIVTTDPGTEALYIGDGVTPGGVPVSAGGGAGGSPLTSKGDLYTFAAGNTRLPVGQAGFVLLADPAAPTGLRWAAAVSGSSSVLTESGGPNDLTIGAVASGQYLRRVGTSVIGANPRGDVTLSAKTSNYTLQASDAGAVLVCSGNVTITLPAGLGSGKVFDVLNVGAGVVNFALGVGATVTPSVVLDNAGASGRVGAVTLVLNGSGTYYAIAGERPTDAYQVALSDETSALTPGAAKLTMRMPYPFRLTGVRGSVNSAPAGGAGIAVDVNKNGVSVFSTRLGIEAGEKSSVTASVQPVLSTTLIEDDAELTFDVDAVGTSVAGAGLKVTLLGYRL